jgi:hypothetical protein
VQIPKLLQCLDPLHSSLFLQTPPACSLTSQSLWFQCHGGSGCKGPGGFGFLGGVVGFLGGVVGFLGGVVGFLGGVVGFLGVGFGFGLGGGRSKSKL